MILHLLLIASTIQLAQTAADAPFPRAAPKAVGLGVLSVEEPFVDLSFDAALAAADQQAKVVLIDFFKTGCAPSTTWQDDKVRAWLRQKTVPIKIDVERDSALASRFHVDAYPTVVLVKSDGTEIHRLVGYRPATAFRTEVADALASKNTVERAQAKVAAAKADVHARMRLGRELAQRGEHSRALEEFLWCWDHGRYASGFGGVRASYLLSDIIALGRHYPDALAALEMRRDALETIVRSGNVEWEDVSDLAALNENLGAEQRTLALYDALKTDVSREVRDLLLPHVTDALLAARRYRDIVTDPEEIVAKVSEQIVMHSKDSKPMQGLPPEMLASLKDFYIQEGAKSYEALLGAGEEQAAGRVADLLLADDSSASTVRRLIHHASRAGVQAAVEDLLRRARAVLPEAEVRSLEPTKAVRARDPERAREVLQKANAANSEARFGADLEIAVGAGAEIKMTGKIVCDGTARVRQEISFKTLGPSIEMTTVVNGSEVWVDVKGMPGTEPERVYRGSIDDARNVFSDTYLEQEVLRDLEPVDVEEVTVEGTRCLAVVLEPKSGASTKRERFLHQMRMVVTSSDLRIVAFETCDDSGTRVSTTRYRNATNEPAITDATFVLQPPPGLAVKQLSEFDFSVR